MLLPGYRRHPDGQAGRGEPGNHQPSFQPLPPSHLLVADQAAAELAGSEVEVDESYHGAKRQWGFHGELKQGRGTQKRHIFGIFERDGEMLTEIVRNCRKQALILGQVSLDSVIYSDGWRDCNGLLDIGYGRHFQVNHGTNEFSRGNGAHINGIESF